VSWDYRFDDNAKRELKKIGPSNAAKVIAFLDRKVRGAKDPRAFGKALVGDKKGLWRYRMEDYRILARIEDQWVIVTVVAVGHRREVYE